MLRGMPSKSTFISSREQIDNASLAHVAYHTGVIRVISAVRGKVECHRKTFLAGGEVAAIERIGLCSGEKTAYWRIVHGRRG